jgi:hypothetical protein
MEPVALGDAVRQRVSEVLLVRFGLLSRWAQEVGGRRGFAHPGELDPRTAPGRGEPKLSRRKTPCHPRAESAARTAGATTGNR